MSLLWAILEIGMPATEGISFVSFRNGFSKWLKIGKHYFSSPACDIASERLRSRVLTMSSTHISQAMISKRSHCSRTKCFCLHWRLPPVFWLQHNRLPNTLPDVINVADGMFLFWKCNSQVSACVGVSRHIVHKNSSKSFSHFCRCDASDMCSFEECRRQFYLRVQFAVTGTHGDESARTVSRD